MRFGPTGRNTPERASTPAACVASRNRSTGPMPVDATGRSLRNGCGRAAGRHLLAGDVLQGGDRLPVAIRRDRRVERRQPERVLDVVLPGVQRRELARAAVVDLAERVDGRDPVVDVQVL